MIRTLTAALALGLAACATALTSQSAPESPVTKPATDASHIPLERLFASPSLSGPSAREVKYSPDGARVSFLKARAEDAARFDLWAFDVATGEASMLVDSTLLEPEEVELSEEEKALRERKRIAGTRGIASYDWGGPDRILVPLGGDLHLVTLGGGEPEVRQLTETEAFEYDARVSPGGKFVSFVRDGAVYAIDLESGAEARLTPEAEPENAISYGVAEFVAQEEMSRYTGYWWSPDDRYLAYTRVDESTVDIIPRFDIGADGATVIEQRYPRAGRPNAVVDLFVRDMETGDVSKIDWRVTDWGKATDQYLARVDWNESPERTSILVVRRVNRDQTELATGSYDSRDAKWNPSSESGVSADVSIGTFLKERQSAWINLSFDMKQCGNHRILSSEESGHRHLYFDPLQIAARERRKEDPAPITSGNWDVAEVAICVAETNTIFFTGFKDTPLEKHLYSVTLEGGEPLRLTEPGKSWDVTVAPDGKSFVGSSSAPNQPPQTGLYRLLSEEAKFDAHGKAGGGAQSSEDDDCEDLVPGAAALQIYCGPQAELVAWIEENALDENHPYAPYLDAHTIPEFGTIEAEDGQEMYYSLHLPPDFDETKQYPVILEVYGGPGVQRVTRNWESPADQFYVQNGYILFRLDNRGSSNRGKKFEDVLYRQMGIPEVRDQLRGVKFLKSLPYVDAERIGVQGWSYGGYMTLMLALQAPEGTFAAAVSGAPVTDWALYDTFYTERYMDTPQDNPDGYEKGSVFYHLDQRTDPTPPLLLIHGMADDNVIFENSTQLMAAMQEKGMIFDLMTYPGQRHGIRGETLATHLMKTRMAFLDRHLKDGDAK